MILTFLSRVCMSMYNYIREHVEENNQLSGVGGGGVIPQTQKNASLF